MLMGRYDFRHPVVTEQMPMFHLLGTPEKDKHYVFLESGHYSTPQQEIKDTLDWFDRYLGSISK